MAVIESIPGVEVHVITNDQPLIEYTDPDDSKEYSDPDAEVPPCTVARYIEAKNNQAFAIRCTVTRRSFKSDGVSFNVYVNGQFVEERIVSRDECGPKKKTVFIEGAPTGPRSFRPFVFAGLNIKTATESNADNDIVLDPNSLGHVQVEVIHVTIGPSFTPVEQAPQLQDGDITISEKAIKGSSVSYSVKFAPQESLTGPNYYFQTTNIDPEHRPAAIFNFYCRSLESLKALLIVPRTPSPPPIEAKDPDDLSREEIAELQRRILSKDTELIKVKRERTEENTPRKKARITPSSQVLELDDDEGVREVEKSSLFIQEPEVIVIDD
ncbi:uncharacterized protein K489DRAFT_324375 [Dissoconium aciculare CBS 342.82]|uniref:DUF7918 domain-containing protein n=1 Tax=Dissoconium aciculare CBS 342.82 TaxID=1314786 RepID=A0A6J3LXK7_9PEZI|nr:uncharacterized protein K489DRAFT_324375 [Dissoconium aciculare CBS 342.82]KAF1820408.1 hypothetical protein K489DRAFT_324375 [Dissoconium aciculare CBS 342.82]